MPNDFDLYLAAQSEDYGSIVILVIVIIIVHGELFCVFLSERFSVSNIFNLFDFGVMLFQWCSVPENHSFASDRFLNILAIVRA